VVVPMLVPLKTMLTNGIGSPEVASVTLPFTVVTWAGKMKDKKQQNRTETFTTIILSANSIQR
jgi:hypothetical protein